MGARISVGDTFDAVGLPGQPPEPVTVTVTGVSVSGDVSLLVRGSRLAPEAGATVPYPTALLLVDHGIWVPSAPGGPATAPDAEEKRPDGAMF
jgi:hypothetical protein